MVRVANVSKHRKRRSCKKFKNIFSELSLTFCPINSFSLAPCTTEIDISALDRLHALFNPSPFSVPTVIGSSSNGAKTSKLNVKIDCQTLDVRLR